MRRIIAVVAGVFVGSMVAAGPAHAQPASPTPVPPAPATSSSEELADMVLDAIDHNAAPTPTVAPQP